MAADRAAPVLGDTASATFPLPDPLPPDVIVIQEIPSATVQEQVLCVATATVVLPPAAPTDAFVGEMANVHEVGVVYDTSFEYPLSSPDASYAVAAK